MSATNLWSMSFTIPPREGRPDYYTTEAFGKVFNRSKRWAALMVKEGKVKVKYLGLGQGRQYIPSSEVERLWED